MMQGKRHTIILWGIIVIAFLTRAGLFAYIYQIDPTRILNPDSTTYDNPARALLQIGRFSVSTEQPDNPEVIRTPGFPIFIAGVYSLFGQRHGPVIVIQILISLAIIALTYRLGLKLVTPRAALFATALLAVDPASFLQSQLFLTETIFTLLILFTAWIALRIIEGTSHQALWAFLLGLAIAGAAHVRPIGYFLIFPAVAGVVLLKRFQGLSWKSAFILAIALFMPWLILVGGWQARNARVAGRAEFSYIQSYNILYYRGAGTLAVRDHISLNEAQSRLSRQVPSQAKVPIAEACEAWNRVGTEIIRQNPGSFIKMQFLGLVKLILSMPGGDLMQYLGQAGDISPFRDILRLPLRLFLERWVLHGLGYFLIFLFCLFALAVSYGGLILTPWRSMATSKSNLPILLAMLGLVAYLTLLSAGPEANFRFRVPFMPILCIYSAAGWERLASKVFKRFQHGRS